MLGPPRVPLGVLGDPWIAEMVLQGVQIVSKVTQMSPNRVHRRPQIAGISRWGPAAGGEALKYKYIYIVTLR